MKPVIRDIFYVMPFGKHKGKTVGEVFEEQPDYLLWAHNEVHQFNLTSDLLAQVKAEVQKRKDVSKQEKLEKMKKDLFSVIKKETEFKPFNPSAPDDIPF